ncbi:hypothetical protein K435DRAFT_800416 [Dendrothele bispora CBS 962.96]|uniref:Uncharacterized protein n=1 Tax=Dendrothele bispora (strain CBS 962.96) TaxID=1314807 RepID=A0A4S8LSS4_DENBC|nr:hypothetical protein K435DRAFT_800416 [Dendrothele bispora CBS 962.96]
MTNTLLSSSMSVNFDPETSVSEVLGDQPHVKLEPTEGALYMWSCSGGKAGNGKGVSQPVGAGGGGNVIENFHMWYLTVLAEVLGNEKDGSGVKSKLDQDGTQCNFDIESLNSMDAVWIWNGTPDQKSSSDESSSGNGNEPDGSRKALATAFLEPVEASAPPDATRQEQLQIKHENMKRFEAFVEAETVWEATNRVYEVALADLETRMTKWVEGWKGEFWKEREEWKEKEEEEKWKEVERKRVGRLAEAERLQELQQVASLSSTWSQTPLVPSVMILKKRKDRLPRCQDHQIPCCTQEKRQTLTCYACRKAKAKCSLTELARKHIKSAPEVPDNKDTNYTLNLFAGELTTKVQEMDKKIDKNRMIAFQQYMDLEEQNYWIIGLIKALMSAIRVEVPPDLMMDSEDDNEDEDKGKGGPEGFFDDQAMEIDEKKVMKEEEMAGARSDEDEEEEHGEDDTRCSSTLLIVHVIMTT